MLINDQNVKILNYKILHTQEGDILEIVTKITNSALDEHDIGVKIMSDKELCCRCVLRSVFSRPGLKRYEYLITRYDCL